MSHAQTQIVPVPKEFEVLEETTPIYRATIKDETGSPLDIADIATITLTHFTTKGGIIVNSRDGQDVKNTNDVTIDGAGLLTWTLQIADTLIEDTATAENNRETHRAIFDYTYPTIPTKRGKHVVDIIIVDLTRVP